MIPVGAVVAVNDGDLLGSVGVIVGHDPDNGLDLVRVARENGRHSYDEVAPLALLLTSPPCTPHTAAHTGYRFHDR